MGVASWSFDLVWAVGGSGPAGAAPAEAGWLAGALVSCLCGGCWGGVGCRVLCGVEDTPVAAWFGGGGCPLLVVGVACCRGSGAVRPGCPARVGLCVVCPLPGVVGGALGVCCGCGWVGCELYSGREHLTVSLRQVFCFVVCCVVCFYERSVDALASGADEGRGGLRYSSGSRLAGCDPRVSEWGDPARVMSCHLHLNCIGCGG